MSTPLSHERHDQSSGRPVRVRLRALPDYEPASSPEPIDPDTDRWCPVPPIGTPALHLAPPDLAGEPADPGRPPVWNEPGPAREVLRQVLTLVLETLDGRRSIGQLRAVLDPQTFEAVRTRARISALSGAQHRLRRLHTCRPSDDVIELCATVSVHSAERQRPRLLAVAGRLVLREGAWRCTMLRPL